MGEPKEDFVLPDQREVWSRLHDLLPLPPSSLTRIIPSDPLGQFFEVLEAQFPGEQLRVLDLGCGNGRNGFYLASRGCDVVMMDFCPHPRLKYYIPHNDFDGSGFVEFYEMDMRDNWSWVFLERGMAGFHAIIDCNASVCLLEKDRKYLVEQSWRVLAPRGLYLFYGMGRSKYLDLHPGPEDGSTYISKQGRFKKYYTPVELDACYEVYFERIFSLPNVGYRFIDGRKYKCTSLAAHFEKKIPSG